MRMRVSGVPALFVAVWVLAFTAKPGAARPAGRQPAGPAGTGRRQPAGSRPSGQPPADQTQLTFRAGINFVTVDAYVSDGKGQPATDLKQSDFEVLEDNKPQKIEQFRFIKVDGNPKPGEPPPQEIRNRDDEEREAARDDTRVFVVFLDDYHTRLGSSLAVRQPLSEFIQNQLRPLDLVAVMYPLMPVTDIDFTRNHAKIINAIQHFEGRKYRYEPRNLFEEQYQRAPTEVVEEIRNQVVMTALRGLSVRLGSMRDGRKSIIYVSEGLQSMLPPQMRSADASMPKVGNPQAFNPFAGENDPREQTAQAFSQADLVFAAQRGLHRGDAEQHRDLHRRSPRPRDQRVRHRRERRPAAGCGHADGLHQHASLHRRGNRRPRHRRPQRPREGAAAGDAGFDGLLSDRLHLRAGTGRRQVPSDQGAVERRGEETRAAGARPARLLGRDDRGRQEGREGDGPDRARFGQAGAPGVVVDCRAVQAGKYVRTWLGTQRGENGKTKVTLVWEPLPKTPVGNLRNDPTPGRVSLIAATEKGDLVYRGRTPDAGQLASANPQATGASAALPAGTPASTAAAPQSLTFEAPPGKLELRMTVEGAGGGVLDQEIRNITIPDLTAARPAISTPRVYAVRTPRELQAIAGNPRRCRRPTASSRGRCGC